MRRAKSVRLMKDIASQRAMLLYKMSLEAVRKGDIVRAQRYVEIMLKVAAKGRVRLSRKIKRGVCRKCKTPLVPGVTSSVRLRRKGKVKRLVVRCLVCGWTRRYIVMISGKR